MGSQKYSVIDLFSGAGGFSLGVKEAGFEIVAAIDFDKHATTTYRHNFPNHDVLEEDLRTFTPSDMSNVIGRDSVDVIIGGPPCQGFSNVKSGNHGTNIKEDERRYLYKPYLAYVELFKPKIFVMENVPGIKSVDKGKHFHEILKKSKELGYSMHEELLNAWRVGVPQTRSRQIIIGVRDDICGIAVPTGDEWVLPTHADVFDADSRFPKPTTLWEAIGDLPCLKAGKSTDMYDMKRREHFVAVNNDDYINTVAKVSKSNKLTSHLARSHSDRDLRDFNRLKEGENSDLAERRGVKMEFPYDRDKFKDKYTKQHRNKLSSTIMAHLSKDGLRYIHPTQSRTFTPREAARIQSFPDYFNFPVPRTHQFTLIGNAVPPLMAKAIGATIKKILNS